LNKIYPIEGVYNPLINLTTSTKYLNRLDIDLKKENPKYSSLPENEKLKQIFISYNWGINKLKKNNFDTTKIPSKTKAYLKSLNLI